MGKTAIAATAFAALIGASAHAADMPTKAPPTPVPPLVASWAGFYIGGHAGGGVAIADVFDPDCFTCNDSALHDGFGALGGQAGYNWQFGHVVVGIEGDLDWQSFQRATGLIEAQELTTTRLDATASLRLRAGLAFDRTLAYLTFGPAWAHANSQSTLFNLPFGGTTSQTTDRSWHDGIAAGAGIEYQPAPHWALRGEYLHLDFRDSSNIFLPVVFPPPGRKNFAYSEELVRLGLDYQFGDATLPESAGTPLIDKARVTAFPTAAAGWSGFYLGGNVGGGIAETQFLDPDCYVCGNASYHRGFAAAGGQLGYDAQWNSLIVGAVGDIDWTSLDQSGLLGVAQTSSEGAITRVQLNALASVRARAGLAVDRTLFYVTAGPAFGHFNTSATLFPATFPSPPSFTASDRAATEDTWRLGLAAGAGVEVLVDPHWSLFGEYLLYEFGSADVQYQPPTTRFVPNAGMIFGYSAQVARIGANYRFKASGPAAPTPMLFKAPAVAANWQGFYLGGNAGTGLFNGDAMEMDCFLCASSTAHIPFAALGAQGGYNWQWGATVLGFEADIDWASVDSSRAFGLSDLPNGSVQQTLDAFASLRARAGLAIDKSLLYVTAGPAIGHFAENTFFQGTPIAYPTSGWQPGLAAGAGIAYRLAPQWSIRAEYLHLAFTDKIVGCGANFVFGVRNCLQSRMQYANAADVARLGIDYAFK